MFKKLKSLFIVEEETESGQTAEESKSPDSKAADNTATVAFEKPQYSAENPPKGKLNEKFVNRLLGAIEDNNIDGFDYLEYKQALQNLNNVEMDEETKFKSALAVAKTLGATKGDLVKSAEHYLGILEKEELKFIDAFKNQMSRQVTQKSNNIKSIEASIEEMKAKIAQLEKDIADRRTQLEKEKSSVDASKAKVEKTKEQFYQAFHVVAEQIKADLEKIKNYLS